MVKDYKVSSYSVAQAKNGLPGLIDRALEGEEVLITRRGRVVAELRPAPVANNCPSDRTGGLEWLRQRRESRPRVDVDTAKLLRDLADEQRW